LPTRCERDFGTVDQLAQTCRGIRKLGEKALDSSNKFCQADLATVARKKHLYFSF